MMGIYKHRAKPKGLAAALGWFSIGLGLVQVLAPQRVSKLIGVERHPVLMRFLGLRELVSGVGILTQYKPTGFLWARVAGDAMDLALLASSLSFEKGQRGKTAAATAAVAGVTVLDALVSNEYSRN